MTSRIVACASTTERRTDAYVDTLENTVDVTELPEASGDAIAQEFEQSLGVVRERE